MEIGKTLAGLRKQKGWSQSELASMAGVSQVMVGKYERGDAIPSFEVAKKMADAFGVSLDHLVGEGQNVDFDQKTMERLRRIQTLDQGTKSVLFNVIDTYLRDASAREAYAS